MIDEATYTDYRARIDAWEAHREAGDDVPAIMEALGVANEMRSAVEVYELHRDKPQKFTAYVEGNGDGTRTGMRGHAAITTWTGDPLGTYRTTREWRDRHGNRRYSIRVRVDWGGEYVGQTQGAGMYVNLRRVRV